MLPVNKIAYIYALIDPDTNNIRYIGRTIFVSKRYSGHIRDAVRYTGTYKRHWIRKLLKEDKKPVIKILEIVHIDQCVEKEKEWIKFYKNTGFLTNYSDGGSGLFNPTQEIRDKMSLAQKKHWAQLSYIDRKNKINKIVEAVRDPKVREKISKSLTGKKIPKEVAEKISLKIKGLKRSLAVRMKISESKKKLMSLIPKEEHAKRMRFIRENVKNKDSTSKFYGTYFTSDFKRRDRPWVSYIRGPDKNNVYIGRYNNELEAAKAYNIKAIDYYGSKAILNDIPGFCYEKDKELCRRRSCWGNCSYRGVTKFKNGYQVQVYRYGYVGRFKDEIEAAKAYDSVALKVFGSKAILNFPV